MKTTLGLTAKLLPLCIALSFTGCTDVAMPTASPPVSYSTSVEEIVKSAERIPTRSQWFEVLRLPNQVYAFWEPGHLEKVNAFLVLGSERDMLYDTGMGIDNLAQAIEDVRAIEKLPERPLMVVNSHNHLDHNGGNRHFDEVWTVNDPWAIRRLKLGVPAGEAGGFVDYWNQLTPHDGVQPPASFSPETHAIPPYPLEQVKFLEEGQTINLGDRSFEVMRMYSHSPDGISLYNKELGMFFGGDTFYGADFLVTDANLLANDLKRIQPLEIRWHYSSHGAQLITAMEQGMQLAAVNKIIAGDGEDTSTVFAGIPLPVQEIDGVKITLAKELLLY